VDEVEPIVLAHLGSIPFGGAAPSRTITDVLEFDLDGLGRPGFVRHTDDGLDFVRVDREGENAIEIPLPRPPERELWGFDLAWTSGDRWVLVQTGGKGRRQAWWLDAGNRTLTSISGFHGPARVSLAGTRDGGFVLVPKGASLGGAVFDRDGQRQLDLHVRGTDRTGPDEQFFAQDCVTCLAGGELAMLSNGRRAVRVFDESGRYLREIDLARAWGREPNYPLAVHADAKGGFLVHDFNGHPSIVRMDAEGKVLGSFEPHYPDGRRFNLRGAVKAASDGTLWTSDGEALLVLDGAGEVQRVLGGAPDAAELGEVAVLCLGPDDRIYAADRRTGAVHVFRTDGTLQHVCVPVPEDFDEQLSLVPLTVTDTHEVLLGPDPVADEGARPVRFAASGTRLESPGGPDGDRYAQRGSDRVWIVGYKALFLVDVDGEIVRRIDRAPDGRWLRGTAGAGVAPDGSIAVATCDRLASGGGTPGIHVYSASGEPVRSFAPPKDMPGWLPLAFDGERLAIGLYRDRQPGEVVLMDAHGRELGRVRPPGEVECWQPFFAAGGDELWLFDGERRIERFALP
jgi:hypothetical protein